MGEVDLDELLDRIRDVDPAGLEAVAAELNRAAGAFEHEQKRVRGLLYGSQQVDWTGAAHASWNQYMTECADKLGGEIYALHRMATVLTEFAKIAQECKDTLNSDAVRPPYTDPSRMSEALLARDRTAERYHDAEKDAKAKLWTLGDSADVGKPPEGEMPPEVPPPWWMSLLFGPEHGPQIAGLGYDEDGNQVPLYRAMEPAYVELAEAGGGGALARLLTRIARGGGPGSKAALESDARELAKEIAESYAGRNAHLDPKVRQWFRIPEDQEVDDAARANFLRVVSESTTKANRAFEWSIGGQRATGVLHYDQSTKRWLAVFFRNPEATASAAEKARAGEFMSTFIPTEGQLDAMLRAASVAKG